jgi:hypothetical protein
VKDDGWWVWGNLYFGGDEPLQAMPLFCQDLESMRRALCEFGNTEREEPKYQRTC